MAACPFCDYVNDGPRGLGGHVGIHAERTLLDIAEPAPPLPGRCRGCRARVYLYGQTWCDENGQPHRCAA